MYLIKFHNGFRMDKTVYLTQIIWLSTTRLLGILYKTYKKGCEAESNITSERKNLSSIADQN